MKPIDYISLASSLAALFSSLIALLTLFEMRAQRRNSLRPEIVIKRSYIYLFWEEEGKGDLPINWYNNNDSARSKNSTQKYTLRIINIGLQTAKDLTVEWQYDINKFIDLIHKYNDDNLYRIEVSDSKWLNIKSKNGDQGINLKNDLSEYLGFMGTGKNDDECLYLDVPISLQTLISVLLSLCDSSNGKVLEYQPEISLILQYKDISGKEYSKTIKLLFSVSAFHIKYKPAEYAGSALLKEIDI
ncbi:hypothetical protein [Paenibacillus agaridevorans]|uniref:hypothetical protein n=1 Tax=Paenibacillus agaridevorans TaxID=171404 RepID=UPI001BE4DB23|nr:hypothetical protein [Paenibacillus agaridevorans]